jgi:hypothetical protein
LDITGLKPGNYTAIRCQVLEGFEYTNATMTNGDVAPLDVPSFKVILETEEFEVAEET